MAKQDEEIKRARKLVIEAAEVMAAVNADTIARILQKTEITKELIYKAIDGLNSTKIEIIKNGIDQMGKIGHHGKSFIARAILEQLQKE